MFSIVCPVSTLVIVNPVAGGGRARKVAARVLEIVRDAGGAKTDVAETGGAGDAVRLARDAAAVGYERVVGLGGDGTFQEIANGLLSDVDGPTSVTLGVVSVGRGNDLARSLGLPRNLDRAAAVASAAPASRHDVGVAGTRVFLCAAGAGFDAQVAAAVNAATRRWQRTKAAYVMTTLAELRRHRNHDVAIEIDGERLERRVLLVAVANGRFYGGGMMICPEADLRDGLLDVCIIGDVSRSEALRQLPGLFSGRHRRHPLVEFRRAAAVRLTAAGTRLHLDGEDAGQLPVDISIRAAALPIATLPGSGD